MTPDWMPPLPQSRLRMNEVWYWEQDLRDYALAAVEAYKRSLKPVAWMYRPRGSHLKFMLTTCFMYPSSEYETVPLHRLDGGDDDASS